MEPRIFRASTVPLTLALVAGVLVLKASGDSWYAAMAAVGIMAVAMIVEAILGDAVTVSTVGAGLSAIVGVAALPLAPLALWVALGTAGSFLIACVLALAAGDEAGGEWGTLRRRCLLGLQAAPLGIGTLVCLSIGGYQLLRATFTVTGGRRTFVIRPPHRPRAA